MSGFTMVDRVAHQVVHGQPQPVGPTQHHTTVVRMDGDLRRVGPVHQRIPRHPVQQVCDVHQFAVLGPGEVARGQLAERRDGGLDTSLGALQVADHLDAFITRQVVCAQSIQVGAHRGERRA
ncbi:Uncharacterised protein [Mycobacteroides abscessus subsp. abscessus]|nr:Uncharacterised protein [Mycobacteroides abscessus subsp. abscessus]